MDKNTPIFEELDPLVFCETWGLTYEEASKVT